MKENYTLLQAYKDVLNSHYLGEFQSVDFTKSDETAKVGASKQRQEVISLPSSDDQRLCCGEDPRQDQGPDRPAQPERTHSTYPHQCDLFQGELGIEVQREQNGEEDLLPDTWQRAPDRHDAEDEGEGLFSTPLSTGIKSQIYSSSTTRTTPTRSWVCLTREMKCSCSLW